MEVYEMENWHYIAAQILTSMAEKKIISDPKAEKKIVIDPKRVDTNSNLFGKENYIWIIAGIAIIALGLILMAGGKSSDPNVFDPKEVYSTTRITIAPILILLGLGLGVFAIFRNPKEKQ